MHKRIKELRPGDLIDLEGDEYADPNQTQQAFKFEYALIEAIEKETDDCIALWIEGVDCFGFPPDHIVTVIEDKEDL